MAPRTVLVLAALLAAGCSGKMVWVLEEGPGGPDTVRVAALHLASYNGPRETPGQARKVLRINYEKTARLVRMAARSGAKVIVTPEYGNIGRFVWPGTRDHLATRIPPTPTSKPLWDLADQGVREYVVRYARLARELKVYLVTHVLERDDDDRGRPVYYNTMVALDPEGRAVARYRKANLWMYENVIEDSGNEPAAFDTPWGRFALLTCFDCVVPWTISKSLSRTRADFFLANSLWQHLPLTGSMAMNLLAVYSGRPVVWANQRRIGLGGGAGVIRPWAGDTRLGIWGAPGVVVANLPVPRRLREQTARLPR